jgi:Cft2 family RNA processing exonuclease
MRRGSLRPQPVFIGGLGRVFTEIYDLESHRVHRQHPSLVLHEALNLVVLDRRQLDQMKPSGARIFVVTAGMMTENTAAHDLALRLMGDERHGVFFVGYADPDTPGGRLKASKPGVPFHFSRTGGEVTRDCQVLDFDLTAHANREELLALVGRMQPRTVVLGHGERDSRAWFETAITEQFPRIKVLNPGPGATVEA